MIDTGFAEPGDCQDWWAAHADAWLGEKGPLLWFQLLERDTPHFAGPPRIDGSVSHIQGCGTFAERSTDHPPLEHVADLWARQQTGPHVKLEVQPWSHPRSRWAIEMTSQSGAVQHRDQMGADQAHTEAAARGCR